MKSPLRRIMVPLDGSALSHQALSIAMVMAAAWALNWTSSWWPLRSRHSRVTPAGGVRHCLRKRRCAKA